MFSKVLVANRGAIRAKCVQAVKELGCKAAVFYTGQDNMSHGVRMADEAYEIHSSDPMHAYNDVESIVELAVRIGADVVHPGYGFLAEDVTFAKALRSHGIHFLGPDPDRLEFLTDKTAMRGEAAVAGMQVVPGSEAFEDLASLQAAAKELGYPVVLKSISGSGGIGVAVVRREQDLLPAYEGVLARADRQRLRSRKLFVEKYLPNARLVEFPVLRDSHGNTLALPEIESSIQRRFQRLVAESPSPLPDRALLKRLATRARKFVDKLDLAGLTTVEFLLDGADAYFLELNTYVPVWHTLISQLTGVDVVKEQIRIAAGDSSGIFAEQVVPRGHVVGVSLNAEDPEEDFVPSPGTIHRFDVPMSLGTIVYGTAESGAAISALFEPVIARVVAGAPSREETIRKLQVMLGDLIIEGVKTNSPFLRAILDDESFRTGTLSAGWLLDRQVVQRLNERSRLETEEEIAALLAALTLHNDSNSQQILNAAAQRSENISFWNFTARLFNRQTMDY